LALSVYNIIKVKENLVEFLIPCTIMITAIFNLLQKNYEQKKVQLNYFFALFFGLIHGLAYANTIRFMLAKDQSMGWSLFSFNVGLELAQILVVAFILFCSYLFVNKIGVKRKWWVFALSISAFCIALKMALERLP
jgi:L-cystine uptake protein TcyP (sodium:dicarboxylate symporter family)